jgi:GDP/UDP-N,N'-diacetylbacillosamine 2-epimerase (hydrolysing)
VGAFAKRMRKIIYVSGTRADFGLMLTVLRRLHMDPSIDFSICITAMHLSPTYGNTQQEIEAEGFRICGKIPVDVENTTGEGMVMGIAQEILGMTHIFKNEKPDIVLLLGDRGEMLAAALVAAHLNIHVAHLHGGERSGTVDEMLRHAISKLSHYHFESSRERLIKMGEKPTCIFVAGAPGLDGLSDINFPSRNELYQSQNFTINKPLALVIFHPVVQEIDTIADQMQNIMMAAFRSGLQVLCLKPNADAGGLIICEIIKNYEQHPDVRVMTHFTRENYLAWLANCDVLLGNSSSGIIEAASFHKPVVNVGSRQNLRERGENVIDCAPNREAIEAAISEALSRKNPEYKNVYGDGLTGERCHQWLKTLPLTTELLSKSNEY